MAIVRPRFVVLDSATLAKAARDYWSPDDAFRLKARTFVSDLRDRSVYVSLTLTHVMELLRHSDETIARDRLSFLRSLPFIAWLRPYDRNWFPGGAPDLLRRELHAVVHEAKRDWRAIVEHVRVEVWETGVGDEMFVDDDHFWSVLRKEAQEHQPRESYVASVARTDAGHIHDLTIGEAKRLPKRPESEWAPHMRRFRAAMRTQLDRHGDRRLTRTDAIATDFANGTLRDMSHFASMGGDLFERMAEWFGVPRELVTDDMTVGDVGELAVYVAQLAGLSKSLDPRVRVTVREVPRDALPSYVLSHRLTQVQRKAVRVSGSDLGDGHISMLTLYADAVEVDKRTCEFLGQVRRADPMLGSMMGRVFRSADYAAIPPLCDN